MRRALSFALVIAVVASAARAEQFFPCDKLNPACPQFGGGGVATPTPAAPIKGTPITGSAGGYDGATAKCPNPTHLCTVEELSRSIRNVSNRPASLAGWITAGPPGNTSGSTADCLGFTTNSNTQYGRTWNFAFDVTGGLGSLTPCNSTLAPLCCR